MKGRTREILLLVTSLFFVVIASEGPLKNTSGNYRARFALTKSLIDLGTIEITKYKNFIGWDQAKINNKAYCAHNPGMSFLMLPSYLLLAKPFSLLFLSGEGKQEFLVESWLTRIPVIAFFFSLAIWIILRLGKIYFFDPKIAILLFFGTIVPMYSFSALADRRFCLF